MNGMLWGDEEEGGEDTGYTPTFTPVVKDLEAKSKKLFINYCNYCSWL